MSIHQLAIYTRAEREYLSEQGKQKQQNTQNDRHTAQCENNHDHRFAGTVLVNNPHGLKQ